MMGAAAATTTTIYVIIDNIVRYQVISLMRFGLRDGKKNLHTFYNYIKSMVSAMLYLCLTFPPLISSFSFSLCVFLNWNYEMVWREWNGFKAPIKNNSSLFCYSKITKKCKICDGYNDWPNQAPETYSKKTIASYYSLMLSHSPQAEGNLIFWMTS